MRCGDLVGSDLEKWKARPNTRYILQNHVSPPLLFNYSKTFQIIYALFDQQSSNALTLIDFRRTHHQRQYGSQYNHHRWCGPHPPRCKYLSFLNHNLSLLMVSYRVAEEEEEEEEVAENVAAC
jgi:hypothetical protein